MTDYKTTNWIKQRKMIYDIKTAITKKKKNESTHILFPQDFNETYEK